MTAMSHGFARLRVAALAVTLFLLTWGVKLTVIGRFGSDLPNWDQWDAESEHTFLPYLQHRLHFLNLFEPHNEHRVACTKALALGLLVLNGQWDARLECVVNAALHAALAVAIFLYGCRRVARPWHGVWMAAVAALVAPPIAWQNVLGGFHSQQIFLVGFSLAAVALLPAAPAGSARWWGGLVCATLALFTMGSGLLAAGAVAAVLAVSGPPRATVRRHGVTIAACLLLFGAGWRLRVIDPQEAPMQAHSVAAFAEALWHSLQWPAFFAAPLAVLVWLPWAWTGWRSWRGGHSGPVHFRVIFAAGLWVILQFAATAYARGAGGPWPASRYLDTVATGVLVNAFAVLVALSTDGFAGWRACARGALAAAWAVVIAVGGWQHLSDVWRNVLPKVGAQMARRDANTAAYLATGNDHFLDGDIPYPSKGPLMERLAHPEIRAILPASLRAPLPLAGQADPARSFAPGAVAPGTAPRIAPSFVGSYTAAGRAAQGVWRSGPLPAGPRGGYWRIEVTGDLGRRAGLSLEMADAQDGARVATIAPVDPTPAAWTPLYLPAPRQPVHLVARDANPTAWFAFSAPVQVPAWSYRAMRLAAQGPAMALAAAIAGVLLLIPFGWLLAPDPTPPAGDPTDGGAGE